MSEEKQAPESCGHEESYGGVAYTCQRPPHPIDGYGPAFRHAAHIDAGLAAEIAAKADDDDETGSPDLLTWGEDELGDGQEFEAEQGSLADYGADL